MSRTAVGCGAARGMFSKLAPLTIAAAALLLVSCSDGPILIFVNDCSHSVELAYVSLSDGAGSWEESIPDVFSLAANETREFATIESHTIELRTADQQTVVGSFAVLGDEVDIVISGELCDALGA